MPIGRETDVWYRKRLVRVAFARRMHAGIER
jgi:hypothetical protein